MIRKPAVAGQFYPYEPKQLREQIAGFIKKTIKKEDALGVICPHAGYMFSGPVAGAVYSRINIPDKAVILCPNHTGRGAPFSIVTEGSWATPLGEVKIASEIGKKILKNSKELEEDASAHVSEHSIEVQLPFLQYLNPEISFVPICFAGGDYSSYEDIAAAISNTIKNADEKILMVASSDMSHYESQDVASQKDREAIDAILELDEKLLLKRIGDFNISMCGYVPVTVMLIACKKLGAKTAELVKYQTSGDVIGGYSEVVGYAGMIVK
ncbi:MAG: AmmeMemoRadiSam system protein B [Candidatus Ratteibacteria bacterium]|nr:AmmeMemoRadiSam system protein B [Candidatus Ratteibacteria bacterium]